jgi:glycosyltransferase involved in cell wall biosynthesis
LRALASRLGLQDAVHFVGYLDRAGELLDCYRAADAFVFASRTETQGLVLLEAMALGVPVVSTAVLGTAEVLRDAEGAVVVREDETEFAAAVLGLLDDAELQARLRAGGVRTAARWSASTLAGRMAKLYGDVAGGAAEALGEPVR